MNKVYLIGNLGKDAQLTYLPNGNAKLDFSLATEESWKDKNSGGWQKKSTWHNVVFFGKQAEKLNLLKGSRVLIEGKITNSSWEKDGKKFYKTEIIAEKIEEFNRVKEKVNDHSLQSSVENISKQIGFDHKAVVVPEYTIDDLPF